MIAHVPWVCLKHALNKRINDAMDRFGTAASWPISEPSGSAPDARESVDTSGRPCEARRTSAWPLLPQYRLHEAITTLAHGAVLLGHGWYGQPQPAFGIPWTRDAEASISL